MNIETKAGMPQAKRSGVHENPRADLHSEQGAELFKAEARLIDQPLQSAETQSPVQGDRQSDPILPRNEVRTRGAQMDKPNPSECLGCILAGNISGNPHAGTKKAGFATKFNSTRTVRPGGSKYPLTASLTISSNSGSESPSVVMPPPMGLSQRATYPSSSSTTLNSRTSISI